MRIAAKSAAAATNVIESIRERDSRASGHDEDSAERRAEDADKVPRQTLERVRLLEARAGHRLRHEADLRRDDEPVAGAVDAGEQDQRSDRGGVGEDQSGGDRLRGALQERRPDEDDVPRDTVGDDAAGDDHDGVEDGTRGEDEAEVPGARSGEREDGERERDVLDGVAEGRDRRRREEQAKRAFRKRPEAFPKRRRHRRGA
jgi:hypothetical protein